LFQLINCVKNIEYTTYWKSPDKNNKIKSNYIKSNYYNIMGGKNKGKTDGNVYVNGSINNNGANVNAGGKISHNTNNGTQIYAQGDVNRNQPFHGKGSTNGSVEIGVVKNF